MKKITLFAFAILPMLGQAIDITDFIQPAPPVQPIRPIQPIQPWPPQPPVDYFNRAQATRTARELVSALNELARQAGYAAQAAERRHPWRAQRYRQVCDQALRLAEDVNRFVLGALYDGASRFETKRELDRLSHDFRDLRSAVGAFVIRDANVDRACQTVESCLRSLRSQVDTPVPPPVPSRISGTCRLDIGGNFFVPKTNVSCTVFGRGATGYEITVNDRPVWHGALQPHQYTQAIQTNKQKVGGHAVRYEVNVFDRFGNRTCIFAGSR